MNLDSIPVWVKKFIVDFVETGLAAVLAVQFFVPASTDEAVKLAAIVGAALLGAFVSAFRRAMPDALAWLKTKLGVYQ